MMVHVCMILKNVFSNNFVTEMILVSINNHVAICISVISLLLVSAVYHYNSVCSVAV